MPISGYVTVCVFAAIAGMKSMRGSSTSCGCASSRNNDAFGGLCVEYMGRPYRMSSAIRQASVNRGTVAYHYSNGSSPQDAFDRAVRARKMKRINRSDAAHLTKKALIDA